MTEFEKSVNDFLVAACPGMRSELSFGFLLFRNAAGGPVIVAEPVGALTPDAALEQSGRLRELLHSLGDVKAAVVPEDLWCTRPGVMRSRLLAQLGVFRSIFARNTQVRRIDKAAAAEFFSRYHTYGDAASRYRYGIFDREGCLVAAASFSAPRVWDKPEGRVRSYEWVRYASLPDVRVVGGMGKVLKAFVRECTPDDIMSYADLEWTDGQAYRRLGFKAESVREPVTFAVDRETFVRTPLDRAGAAEGCLFHCNAGSVKYRLTLHGRF